MNRTLIAIALSLMVGFAVGRWSAPDKEPTEMRDDRLPSVQQPEKPLSSTLIEVKSESQQDPLQPENPPSLRSEISPDIVDPQSDRSAVMTLAIVDRQGNALPDAAAAIIVDPLDSKRQVALLPTRRLLGAAHCSLPDESGRLRPLTKVAWRTFDGALVALNLPTPWKARSWRVATSAGDLQGHGWNLPLGRRPLTPVHVQEVRWSSKYMSEVGALLSGGWVGLFLNEHDQLRGFVLPTEDQAPNGIVLPVDSERLVSVDTIAMDLLDFVDMTFGDDPDLLLRDARELLAAGRYSQAVSTFHRALDRRPELMSEVSPDLLLAHKGTLTSASARSRPRVRLDLLGGALADFPRDVDLLIDQAKTARTGAEFELAWNSWKQAFVIDPDRVGSLPAIAAGLYLDWAKWMERSARVADCIAVLREGLAEAGMDEGLLVMLSRILMKERAYGEVAVLLRDAFFANPDLEMSLGASLARAERMQDRPGNVVIDYPPGSKSIHATVALNGVVGEFIVDTGASTTMVPDDLARRASLDTGVNVPRVLIRTAGNERILPFSPVDSVSVGSLSVTGLSVVVGDLSGLGNLGLLGMDFLGQFGFENDSVNGRFVIFAR